MGDDPQLIVIGQISGVFGIKGWIKVRSYTQPPENVLCYSPWCLRARDTHVQLTVTKGQAHGSGLIAKLDTIDDRVTAQHLVGCEIVVERASLPETDDGDFYWADLIGLSVVTKQGEVLGTVRNLMETGANDVLIVEGEREWLIPFIPEQVIVDIDLAASTMVVDWDPEF